MQPVIWKVDTKIDIKWRHHRSLTMDLYLRKKKIVAKISSTEKNKKLKKNNGASGWGNDLLGIVLTGFANFIDEWSQCDFCFTNFGVILGYLKSSITTKKAIFRLSCTWSCPVYTSVRDARSSCGSLLTWKAQIYDGGHRVNFDRNLPSSCYVTQYNSLISMI